MKTLITVIATSGTLLTYTALASGPVESVDRSDGDVVGGIEVAETSGHGALDDPAAENELIDRYCVRCHSERRMQGNMSLESFDAGTPFEDPVLSEKMVVKLRAEMMPPPGANRPAGDSLTALVESLEQRLDSAAFADPNPGGRTFQRLNRAEYERSVRDLLGLEIDAGEYLPLDTKSNNFDNIADVQMVSPTLLDSYLTAAAEVSRLAVGNPNASPSEHQYRIPRWVSQTERVEGAPFGTRGGISVNHVFPADGEYVFRFSLHHETTGTAVGNGRSSLATPDDPEQVEISIDGERVALLDMDRWMHVSNPEGVEMETESISVTAGPKQVSAAFVKRQEGPVQDLVRPHDWSLASTAIAGEYGVLSLPHMRDFVIAGPWNVTGVSDHPVREQIFSCYPERPEEERPCAKEIIERLGSRAFRRPLTDDDRTALLRFFEMGVEEGGFDIGIRTALEAILASPHFVFRFEEAPGSVETGDSYRINDVDLAARLSYFLWGLPPDQELMSLATAERLSDPETLEAQVRRMLQDPRAEALSTRFASQWLRLQDLEKVHPDVRMAPDYHQQLADAMLEETQRFFTHLVREDRSMFELYTADYTFVNERLARHYDIPGVTGDDFRKVQYPYDYRRGILGHGSILTLTSHAGRTSPVLRGKWIMEVVMGTPPPPPPPGVPPLDETSDEASEGRMLTTKERMEMHRANPTCNACHRFIDPLGLALDSYDMTGKWRIKENGVRLETSGELYDGTPITGPRELQEALLDRPVLLLRSFTSNLMAYALGRRVEHFDQPTIRKIVREAAEEDYSISAFVLGVVKSDAFQMQRAGAVATDAANQD
ncbi:MAG: DUF1592 domain-containing protein [Gemmatimonadota bacterium]|nr:DUF1592 domain-containing protein [Gemmatimonadota bacterium]